MLPRYVSVHVGRWSYRVIITSSIHVYDGDKCDSQCVLIPINLTLIFSGGIVKSINTGLINHTRVYNILAGTVVNVVNIYTLGSHQTFLCTGV